MVFNQIHHSRGSPGVGCPGNEPHRLARSNSTPPPGICLRHPPPLARRPFTRRLGIFRLARGDPLAVGVDATVFLPRRLSAWGPHGSFCAALAAQDPPRRFGLLHRLHTVRLCLSGCRRTPRQTSGERVPRLPQLSRLVCRGEPPIWARRRRNPGADATARCGSPPLLVDRGWLGGFRSGTPHGQRRRRGPRPRRHPATRRAR